MIINPVQDVFFDDAATMAMGEAFEQACVSLHRFGISVTARELIAKRISVGRDSPVPAYASVTHAREPG
jgi:hypothetical protein